MICKILGHKWTFDLGEEMIICERCPAKLFGDDIKVVLISRSGWENWFDSKERMTPEIKNKLQQLILEQNK